MSAPTENTVEEQSNETKPWQFSAGQSGNPAGRPKGSRNKTTLAVQALLDGESEEITRKAIELAKAGDMTAIRLVLERIIPPRKDSPIQFDMPLIKTAEDIPNALAKILQEVAASNLTPAEGQAIASLLEQTRKVIETCELERKLEGLQTLLNGRK